ncbi:MAG: hypothetical protein LLG00_15840 [Planctomycetaceae bacterium]|nr:hypothetical protein [Planctomycetaceae bacterium]
MRLSTGKLFGCGQGLPSLFVHPNLGALRRDEKDWVADVQANGVPLIFRLRGDGDRPNDQLLALASSVLPRVGEFEKVARSFIAEQAADLAQRVLTVAGVDFQFPCKDWIELTLKRDNPDSLRFVAADRPIFSLCFGIENDNDVVEVTFSSDRPIHVDCH